MKKSKKVTNKKKFKKDKDSLEKTKGAQENETQSERKPKSQEIAEGSPKNTITTSRLLLRSKSRGKPHQGNDRVGNNFWRNAVLGLVVGMVGMAAVLVVAKWLPGSKMTTPINLPKVVDEYMTNTSDYRGRLWGSYRYSHWL